LKIAVLSDIHGNYEAWKAVSNEVQLHGIRKIWVLGDICGYYYHTAEILDELTNYEVEFIRGNHEIILKDLLNDVRSIEEITRKYGSGHYFSQAKLSSEKLKFITEAPDYKEINIGGLKILLCHGSPLDPNQYLYPDTPGDILNACHIKDFNFIFVGHSHYQFAHQHKNSFLINAGSVGQSRRAGGVANWAILDVKSGTCELKSTPYDTRQLLESIILIDPELPYLRNILTRDTHA
jgi:putative phosphoesterase